MSCRRNRDIDSRSLYCEPLNLEEDISEYSIRTSTTVNNPDHNLKLFMAKSSVGHTSNSSFKAINKKIPRQISGESSPTLRTDCYYR
jgi:hypothetical protein